METPVNTPLRTTDYPAWAIIRGNQAVFDPATGWWRWCDTGEPMGDPDWTAEWWPDGGLTRTGHVIHFPDPYPPARGCSLCGLLPDENGHDACLGDLLGIVSACCGHGDAERAYRRTFAEAEEIRKQLLADGLIED